MGSDVVVHRETRGDACPCLTAEGFRDPAWHQVYTGYPVCNEEGLLAVVSEVVVKGSVQPARTAYGRPSQRANDLLGLVQRDDKIGILPCTWDGVGVDLTRWSESGSEYLLYDGDRYTVVSADKVPDVDGDPSHHWEVGLRLLSAQRPEPLDTLYPDDGLYPESNLYPADSHDEPLLPDGALYPDPDLYPVEDV